MPGPARTWCRATTLQGEHCRLALLLVLSALLLATAPGCSKRGVATGGARPHIEFKAAISPVNTASVSTPIDGRIMRILVAEGAVVKAGDPVAELSNATVERDLAYARAQVAAANARLRSRGPQPVAGHDERLEAAALILRNRKEKLDKMQQLFATGDIARADLREAENEYAAARRDYAAERDRGATPAADPEVARLELERAHADEKVALERKEQLIVRSTASGRITRLLKREGESIYARESLVEIVDNTSVEARAPIAAEVLPFVRAGSLVDVKVETIPVRRFREPVNRIETGADGRPAVVVSLPNPDQALNSGVPATITIQ